MERIVGFQPISHGKDRVLILGSMPSVESLKQDLYYANRTNRFWPVLSMLYDLPIETREQKLRVLEYSQIALWDICHSCIRKNSADATIKEIVCNDIPSFLQENPSIQKILCNGKTSYTTLAQYFPDLLSRVVVCPSTSAANARYRLKDLVHEYERILKHE